MSRAGCVLHASEDVGELRNRTDHDLVSTMSPVWFVNDVVPRTDASPTDEGRILEGDGRVSPDEGRILEGDGRVSSDEGCAHHA